MANKYVSSYKIECHHKFSWSYEYTIDGKKRDIIASSVDELKEKVLERGFPWDDEIVPKSKEVIIIRERLKYSNDYENSSKTNRRYYEDDYVYDEPFYDDIDVDDRGWH